MAHNGTELDQETVSCSICLDLLKDPVTIPCGHSYCINCIKTHWDEEDEKKIYSCPQCRQTFTPRPVLVKNVILAALVEELEKTKERVQSAPADHCYAGPEDVACDVCTGRKLKALKSCQVCLVSYCQKHLQPHFESPAFAKHKLMDPLKKLQENICCLHNEVMKMFCNTDKKCICYLCSKDDHKGHDTFSVVTGSTRQKELNKSRQKVQQKIRSKEKKIKALQQKVEVINGSANKSLKDIEKIFSELINLIRNKSSHVKQQIRFKQKIEVSRLKMLQEMMEQEITDLKKKDAGLEQLSHTEDHTEFLHVYPSLSQLAETPDLPSVDIRRLTYFGDVTTAVSEVRDELQDTLREKWTNIPLIEPEPKTRAEFLKHSCEITLDPNTANSSLYVDEGERKIRMLERPQSPTSHPDRFAYRGQVLSRECLPERCYWEVEFSDRCHVAVAYKNIRRDGHPRETGFGYNDKSWVLTGDKFGNMYMHNEVSIFLSGPQSYRVGVYLDHSAGILSFYSISETMTLLHRVQTTFTQPLYAGLGLDLYSSFTAELCELK